MRVDIKPLSVNRAWRGRLTKTFEMKRYTNDVLLLLRPMDIPEGNLHINIEYGFSNKGADIDNPCKPFIDVLQKKYGFNDSRIYGLNLKKVIVKKGQEYIDFEIRGME